MQKQHLELVENQLDDNSKRALKQISEKGASSWLTVLPLKEHGFDLNKNEFRDINALRYNRNVSNLPPKCPSGNSFDLNHSMNRKKEFLSVKNPKTEISKESKFTEQSLYRC